jgi:rubrerythrin
MITGKEDTLQALIEAFLMEKGTKEFYSSAAETAVNTDAKKTFRELSEWEEKHMDFIHFLYQSINNDREVESFEQFNNKTAAPDTEAGIPIAELREKMEKYNFTDDVGALTFALEIEGKAYNLYRRMSEKAEDANARVIFKEMMEQEVKHINYLKELRVKLVDVYKL